MVLKLDPDQRNVVKWKKGAALVNAGPGSGKTRVVVERIKKLIEDVEPASILATTFTKKAAEEMQARLKDIKKAKEVQIKTTHSYTYSLLRTDPKFYSWALDEKDQAKTILKMILGYKDMRWRVDISLVMGYIAMMRNKLISPEEANRAYYYPQFAEAYEKYHAELQAQRLLTFDDMLYYGTRLLLENKETREREQSKYKYVIVDEAQDSNHAQIVLAETVASPENNLMVVGDVDQAIYAWRGAMPEHFLEFPTKYNATIFNLGRNYRCPKNIVEKAGFLIECNEKRFSKEMIANKDSGEIVVIRTESANEEAIRIGEMIQSSLCDWKDNAILLRLNAHTRAFEEEFPTMKIPFVIWGDSSFYMRKEIQDLLSYLKVIVRPEDHVSGVRALNRPFRYIGMPVISDIISKSHRVGFFEAVREVAKYGPGGLKTFVSLFEGITSETNPTLFLRMLVPSYLPYLEEAEGTDTLETSRASNIFELVKCSERFGTIRDFLQFTETAISRSKKNKRMKNAVQIMTIHRAKGCEFEQVFMVNTNAGIIPHAKGDMEEERRLAYVGMTRAKSLLVVSARMDMETSPFVYESRLLDEQAEA